MVESQWNIDADARVQESLRLDTCLACRCGPGLMDRIQKACDAIRSNRIGSFAICEMSGCRIRRLQRLFFVFQLLVPQFRSATAANRG